MDYFLGRIANDYMRRCIRAAPSDGVAIKFCVEHHRNGGGSFESGDFRGWIDGFHGNPRRGLHVLDCGWKVDTVIPWPEVIQLRPHRRAGGGSADGDVRVTATRRQSQLVLPLLSVIGEAGGSVRAKRAADQLAERIGLSAAERTLQVETTGGKRINAFDREVRWVHQLAKLRGLTCNDGPGRWALTDLAADKLRNARPGVVVTIFESERGMVLWTSAEAIEGHLDAGSINAIVTSPPYLLGRARRKEYQGPQAEREYVAWLADRAAAWYEALADDGSLFLNLGDCWIPGTPTQSLYVDRLLIKLVDDLGYHLAERLYWENPSKLPAPAEWVTIRRIRACSGSSMLMKLLVILRRSFTDGVWYG